MKTLFKNILRVSILLVISIAAGAQDFRYPVVARITQTASYPIYLSEYANPAQQNFSIQLQVRDNILATRRVRLKLFIESSSINVQSTPVVRNETIIELSAGQTLDLPSNLVANYFENYNLAISPAQYAQSLPEGAYRFGIQVIDANTGLALSGIQYAAPVWITVNEPPVWVLPQNESVQAIENPQNVNFKWAPRHISATDVEYEFTITELNVPLGFRGNIQNLFFAQPAHYTVRTRATDLNYNYTLPPLLPNKIYAYRVRAIAKNGLEDIGIFRNNGFSEVQWFRYMPELLPPYNVNVERLGEEQLALNWNGYENQTQFVLNYRQKGENTWKENYIPRANAEVIENSFEEAYGNFDSGNYEFRIGAFAEYYPQPVFSEILNFKDSLARPYNVRSQRIDSTSAFVKWFGNQAHWSYRLEYKTPLQDNWRQITFENAEDVSLSNEVYEFGTIINGISSDTSYIFRVVGIDYDKEENTSRENYLVKKSKEIELLKLKEKQVYGTISWVLLRSEENQGPVSGAPSFLDSKGKKSSSSLVSSEKLMGFNKHLLANANIGMFADAECQILIKSTQANELGYFKINFPVEALRGGEIPKLVYLKFSDKAFGTFVKEVRTDFIADEYNLGDWVVSAKSLRIRPIVLPINNYSDNIAEHKITIYRRVNDLEAAPYLQNEHMGRVNTNPVVINNGNYYKVGELNSGQIASGLFSTVSHMKQEFLLKYEGPVPYKELYQKETFEPKGGVWQYDVVLKPSLASPFIYGVISAENRAILSSGDLRVELFLEDNLIETTFPFDENQYRANIPLNNYKSDGNYVIKVYYQGDLAKEVPLSLSASSLGTELNIEINANQQVAVILKLKDEYGKGIDDATVLIDGKTYHTKRSGWVSFSAKAGTSPAIKIQRDGYQALERNIQIKATTKNAYTPNIMIMGFDFGLKASIYKDVEALKNNEPFILNDTTIAEGFEMWITNAIYQQLFNLQNTNSVSVYGGMMALEIVDNSKPLPFTLTITVRDKNTKDPIPGVKINENTFKSILGTTRSEIIADYIGQTNSQGILTYQTHIGKGQKNYSVLPDPAVKAPDGNDYGEATFDYNFPNLNATSFSKSIVVELESGAVIKGIVYRIGTTTPIPNARVNIEFPGIDTYVYTNAQGFYSYRFTPTPEENFVTITTEAEGYSKRTVYIATAKSYGSLYERDIYLRTGSSEELEVETIDGYTIGMSLSLYNYQVRKITKILGAANKEYSLTELKRLTALQPQPWAWTLSGVFADKEGRVYEFEGAIVTLKANKSTADSKVYNIFIDEILSRAIPLNTIQQNRKFFETIKIADSEPLFLGPLYMNLPPESNKNRGVIYFNNLAVHETESAEIKHIIAGAKEDGGYYDLEYGPLMANYQSISYLDERYGKRKFVISCSEEKDPIISFEAFSGKDFDENHFQNLLKYYDNKTSSKKLINQYKLLNARSNTGMYFYNNVLFKSFSISNKGPQINKVMVMPVISIENIKIDLMNIDFVRLSENQIKDILIDYSYSPRTLSMGEDIVKAQIEEVYIEKEGVDVVYFTNNGENLIDLKSPNMTPINYNANGIFYSDYQNQKEIVQTAAVLNEVQMYQIPEPAMGPGFRIKVSSLFGMADSGTGYIEKTLENTPKYAFNGNIPDVHPLTLEEENKNELKLEGTADIAMDPHNIKTFWKYKDKKWDVILLSYTAKSKPWGDIYAPKSLAIDIEDSSDVSLSDETTFGLRSVDMNQLKGAKLNVNYGLGIPALGSFEMECEAQFDPVKKRFIRSTTTGKVEVGIPEVFDAKVAVAILLDTAEVVSGVFVSGEVTITPVGYGGSLAGGYACVESASSPGSCDKIWGFQVGIAIEDGVGKKPKSPPATPGSPKKQAPFRIYGAKFGYLYDEATNSSFLLASATLGIGKQSKFDAELFQVMPDSKEDSTEKAKTRDKKLQTLADLEAEATEDQRNTEKTNAETKVNNKKQELTEAKADKRLKKDALDVATAEREAAEKEYKKKKKDKDKAQDELNDLVAKGGTRDDINDNLVTESIKTSSIILRKNQARTDSTTKSNNRQVANEHYFNAYKERDDKFKEKNDALLEYNKLKFDPSASEAQRQTAKDKYTALKTEFDNAEIELDTMKVRRSRARKDYDNAVEELTKSEKAEKENTKKIEKLELGITKLDSAENRLNRKVEVLETVETAKNEKDSLFNEASVKYTNSKTKIDSVNFELTSANSALSKAERDVKAFADAKQDTVSANKAYTKALERREKIDSTDASLRKRYSSSDSTRIKGLKAFALENLFVIATGRSPFEPKEHKFTVENAELTFSIGKNGATITGAGEFGVKGQSLFSTALMLYTGAGGKKVDASGFRIFLTVPSFTTPKLGPVTDITISAQLEFGNGFYANSDGETEEKADVFLMGSLEGTIQVHPVVYVNANARFVFAVNANTDQNTLENRTAAGANLSETARKIVKFFGSSFNTIAEEAIGQRMSFFGALPEQYIENGNTFSGFYIGAKASALAGRAGDFDLPGFMAGSYRVGAGLELGLGILKSIGTDSWEFRLGVNPIFELTYRMRAPIEAILIDERIDYLSKFCLATGYNATTSKHYIKLIYSIIKVDRVIGEVLFPTPAEISCNTFGLAFIKPCIGIYVKYDSDKVGDATANGFFIDTKLEEDPMQDVCPFEW